ncbi:MAG: transcriptional regulator [Devosia sp.]
MRQNSVSFGSFIINRETGTLLRDGLPVNVGYRAFLLLKTLLQRPGEIFTKAELFEAAWPGTVVEETNLSVQIAALRKTLGVAPGNQDWIATIPRVGYRFQGEVNPLALGYVHIATGRTGPRRNERGDLAQSQFRYRPPPPRRCTRIRGSGG